MNQDFHFASASRPVHSSLSPAGSPHPAATACAVTSAPRNAPLADLCDALDAIFSACARFPEPSDSTFFARSLRLALAQAAAEPMLLDAAQREGSPDHYRRHVLAADSQGRYAIASLVWMPGQASPVHAHHTWCGYAVIEGTLSETVFEWQAEQECASATRVQPRARGAVSFVRGGRQAIHRLGNPGDACAPAISLHIYGVPGERMGTHVNDIVREAATPALI